MNAKDLKNFVSYVLAAERKNPANDNSIFDILEYMDFENVGYMNTLELAWIASSNIDIPPENGPYSTVFWDAIFFVFSKINWFTKTAWDVNKYVNNLIEYLKDQPFCEDLGENYLKLRICGEIVIFDLEVQEWYGEAFDELPDHINAIFDKKESA